MKIRSSGTRFKKSECGDHIVRHTLRFERTVFNRFAKCPHVLQFTSRERAKNHPCRSIDSLRLYHPENLLLADRSWFLWLADASLKGRVVVKLRFHGWYSTILLDSIEEMISETTNIRFEFQHKSDAVMFKLVFADPNLEWRV